MWGRALGRVGEGLGRMGEGAGGGTLGRVEEGGALGRGVGVGRWGGGRGRGAGEGRGGGAGGGVGRVGEGRPGRGVGEGRWGGWGRALGEGGRGSGTRPLGVLSLQKARFPQECGKAMMYGMRLGESKEKLSSLYENKKARMSCLPIPHLELVFHFRFLRGHLLFQIGTRGVEAPSTSSPLSSGVSS